MTTTLDRRNTTRRRGMLALGLVALNLGLVGLNLAKRDVVPSFGLFDETTESAVATTVPSGDTSSTVAANPATVTSGPATTVAVVDGAQTTTVAAPAADPEWPNGSGPVPEGPPQPRRAKLRPDGRLELSGSAPSWAVATKVVQFAGEKLPGGPAAVDNLMTWHPDATADTQAGDVVLDQAASFAPGLADIDPASLPTLDLAAQIMVAHPTVFAVIIGHTDDSGDENLNAELSAERADAVVAYLVGKGVNGGQLVVAAAGEDDPMGDNTTEEGRLANRRIEIQFKNFLIADATFGGSG